MRLFRLTLITFIALLSVPAVGSAATCSDYPNQAAAQAAADTRDADGDGIYCESLSCPCSNKAGSKPKPKPKPPVGGGTFDPPTCTKTGKVVSISFSRTKYRNIRSHWQRAIKFGSPSVLTINRKGADDRRRSALTGIPTKPGHDRDEFPPAMARTSNRKVSVAYVPSSENRSHGASMGIKLRRWCSGQRFRVVWF